MTVKTYDTKSYELAEAFLKDSPHLDTMDHCHHLACAIQTAIEDYIEGANRNYEPKETGDAWAGGFAENH